MASKERVAGRHLESLMMDPGGFLRKYVPTVGNATGEIESLISALHVIQSQADVQGVLTEAEDVVQDLQDLRKQLVSLTRRI